MQRKRERFERPKRKRDCGETPRLTEREEEMRITGWEVKSAGGADLDPSPALSRGSRGSQARSYWVVETQLQQARDPGLAQHNQSGTVRQAQKKGERSLFHLSGGLRRLRRWVQETSLQASREVPESPSCLEGRRQGCGREKPSGCSAGWTLCLALSPLPSPESILSAAPSLVRCLQVYLFSLHTDTHSLPLIPAKTLHLYSMLQFTSHVPAYPMSHKGLGKRQLLLIPVVQVKGKLRSHGGAKAEPSLSIQATCPQSGPFP